MQTALGTSVENESLTEVGKRQIFKKKDKSIKQRRSDFDEIQSVRHKFNEAQKFVLLGLHKIDT